MNMGTCKTSLALFFWGTLVSPPAVGRPVRAADGKPEARWNICSARTVAGLLANASKKADSKLSRYGGLPARMTQAVRLFHAARADGRCLRSAEVSVWAAPLLPCPVSQLSESSV